MNTIRAPPKGEPYMNDILALLLLGLLLFIVQCKCDHRNRDLAELARRNTWLAWQAMHPELFTPGSKGDHLDRTLFARSTSQPPTRRRRIPWPNLARYHFPLPKSPSPS